MQTRRTFLQLILTLLSMQSSSKIGYAQQSPTLINKLVIAHRGASGYLPEHTLPAKTMAYGMGADYLEQDVVFTLDKQAVVLHDIYLDGVSDVATLFPDRAREDGKHYVIDFTLAELQRLSIHERVRLQDDQPKYAGRFPLVDGLFRVHTLDQEIRLIKGLNQSTRRDVGIYVEVKSPGWHAEHGVDAGEVILNILKDHGYTSAGQKVFIQSFDPETLRQLKQKTPIPLIQLIGENSWWPGSRVDYGLMKTSKGLKEIATYAAGIGPWYRQIYLGNNNDGSVRFSDLVENAHLAGLQVHPYTLRIEDIPDGIDDFESLLRLLLVDQDVDGVFTDFPDRVKSFLIE